jgi:hypothetical protein
MEKQRTPKQNNSLHEYFERLAEELNDSGLDMRKVLKEAISIPWNKDTIKEYLWKPVQESQIGKKSTTELTTKEVDLVYITLNRHLGEKFGISVSFPIKEEQ